MADTSKGNPPLFLIVKYSDDDDPKGTAPRERDVEESAARGAVHVPVRATTDGLPAPL